MALARCIDLPTGQSSALLRYYTLTLSQDGSNLYAVNAALGLIALVTLRIVENGPTALEAVLQAFGDSCALIQRAATGEIESFPLGSVDEFDRPPICLPSLPTLFQRRFHRGSERTLTLASGDRVMLAIDAVACWIIGGANGRYAPGAMSSRRSAAWSSQPRGATRTSASPSFGLTLRSLSGSGQSTWTACC